LNPPRRKRSRGSINIDNNNADAAVPSNKNGRLTPQLQPQQKRSKEETNLIRDYHVIEKRIAQLDTDPSYKNNPVAKATEECRLRTKLEALGGIDGYQKASLRGEKQGGIIFNSAHWVLDELASRHAQLRPLLLAKKDASNLLSSSTLPPLTLLDVGAIKNHYCETDTRVQRLQSLFHLRPTSIDLNPQDDEVLKANFLDYAKQELANENSFDVVVLSLCVNFEGSPTNRGEMLRLAARLLPEGGLLFLLLPASCIYNSRYMDLELLLELLEVVGLELADHQERPASNSAVAAADSGSESNSQKNVQPTTPSHKVTAKLFFAVLRKRSSLVQQHHKAFKRSLRRGGSDRNNFCILLAPLSSLQVRGNGSCSSSCVPKKKISDAAVLSRSARRNKRAKAAKRKWRAASQTKKTQLMSNSRSSKR